MRNVTRIGTIMALTLTLAAAQALAADVTLSTNAWLNANGQLTNATQGVLLTATSGTGTAADPYVFDVAGNLNMGSYTILGNTANTTYNQYSATWRVTGNVTGTGNFDSHTGGNHTYGGNVHIEAGGTIALNRIRAYATMNSGANGGSVYLWATGTVSVATYIDTHAGYNGAGGAVTIRSEGPVSGQGIAISGSVTSGDGGAYSILTEAGASGGLSGGAVSLYCRTNITLAAGISTRYGTAGAVWIRGDVTDASARAGTVSIGGTAGIRSEGGGTGGNVTIRASTFQLTGGISTKAACYMTRTGNVDIDVLENATIGGVIDTRMLNTSFSQGSPGYVKIVARRTALLGMDAAGYSIRTWPGTLNNPASSASAAGDADVTLTGVDTSAEIYNPANPTNSMTSSIYVAGKINTGRWLNNNAMGNVRITAVEVQLKGDVTNSSSTASSIMSIRYGTNAYGVVTHLVENGVRWNGVASHNITYFMASGTNTFAGDVPYAGKLDVPVPATIENRPATNITTTSATFRGYLANAGSPTAAVSVIWGQAPGVYSHTNSWNVGDWCDYTYPTTNLTLAADGNYYYTFVATNAGGTVVATPAQYLITGPLTALTGDGICDVSATDTASIAISRPGTCVSGQLTVNYALSGAGTGYVSASPASGFMLAAGQQSTNVVFTPVKPNVGAPLGVTLTLLPGAYPGDALASDSITVTTVAAPDVTMTNDVYIDAADGGKLKYVSGGGVVAVPWPGATLDGQTYAYTYQFQNLDMGGYNIHGALNHSQSQASALFQASGNVSGGGSFQFHTAAGNLSAGNLRLEAAGSIALSNVWIYATTPNGVAASTYLWAKGGPVTLTGSLNAEGASTRAAPVVVRSEGSVGSRGIAVAGGNSGYSIRTHNGGSSSGGKAVWLCTEGDITLGGDVVATASGGDVTIRGSYTNAALRAGGVVVRGSIPTWFITAFNSGYGAGNIAVLATNLVVDGSLLTYCSSLNQRGGGIRVDVTGEARFGGYLDTHTEWDGYGRSSPGPVYILARHTAINGTNTTGHSILTKPTATSGSFWNSQPGDGNITLTNVDTSTSRYNPAKPLQSDTSSLSVSGKVEAAYCSANIQGDIFLSAVEVQLAGEIATSAGPNSDIAVHYGVTTHGIVTHLVENGVRWNGSGGHNVTYGIATPVFYADVPYRGIWHPAGTVMVVY